MGRGVQDKFSTVFGERRGGFDSAVQQMAKLTIAQRKVIKETCSSFFAYKAVLVQKEQEGEEEWDIYLLSNSPQSEPVRISPDGHSILISSLPDGDDFIIPDDCLNQSRG
jgi:hypothetical protein